MASDSERIHSLEQRLGAVEVQFARQDERWNYQIELLHGIKANVEGLRQDYRTHEKQDEIKFADLYSSVGHLNGGLSGVRKDIGWVKKIGGAVVTALAGWIQLKK